MHFNYIVANNVSGEIYYVGEDASIDSANSDMIYLYSNTVFNDIVTHWWYAENYTTVAKQDINLTYSHSHTTHQPFEEIDVGPGTIGRTLDEYVYRPEYSELAEFVVEAETLASEWDDVITFFPGFDKIEVSGTQDITVSGIPTDPYTVVTLGESVLDVELDTVIFSSSNNHTLTITSPKYITKTLEIVEV